MNNYDDSDNEDDHYLDDNDPEFIDFKENIKIWLKLDDDINTLNQAIKERKKKKNEITPELLDFMERYKIHDLNTKDGHLKYQKSIRLQPVSKKYLISKLSDFFKNMNKSEKVVNFLYEGRDKKESYNLKRIKPK